MDREEMRQQTKKFALRIIRMIASLPKSAVGDVLGRQVLKSGTSIGANYREAGRASSKRQFTTTLEISLREADETMFWLELIVDSETLPKRRLSSLIKECDEIIAILVATIKSSKGN